MILGGLLEWILGNSFPAVVFCTFGSFWLSYGGVLNPSFAAFASFAGENEASAAGLETTGFNAGLGESSLLPIITRHFILIHCFDSLFCQYL